MALPPSRWIIFYHDPMFEYLPWFDATPTPPLRLQRRHAAPRMSASASLRLR